MQPVVTMVFWNWFNIIMFDLFYFWKVVPEQDEKDVEKLQNFMQSAGHIQQ